MKNVTHFDSYTLSDLAKVCNIQMQERQQKL